MRKSNLHFKSIAVLLLFFPYNCFAAPYVKNLHKKCLSKHQDCALECATSFKEFINDDVVNEEAIVCITTCINEYKECESILAKMRRLNELYHFELKDGKQYKPLFLEEEDDK